MCTTTNNNNSENNAKEVGAATVALHSIDKMQDVISAKDEIIAELNNTVANLNTKVAELAAKNEKLAEALKDSETVFVLRNNGWSNEPASKSAIEYKRNLEKELREEMEATYSNAVGELKELRTKQAELLEANRISYEVLALKLNNRHKEIVLELESEMQAKKDENSKLKHQIERLEKGAEFGKIEVENLKLRERLAKLNRRLINWDYFATV